MAEETALTIYDAEVVEYREPGRYDDDLARAGQVADQASRTDAFAEYHAEQTDNTRIAQLDALKCFSAYLAAAHIQRQASDLYQDELDEGLSDDLREQLAAVERAEERLAAGTYGLSIESGQPIPDERLEAVPTAELTVAEERASN